IYFSSPERTRLALGPGRAVLILGPARVLVVMDPPESSRRSSVFVRRLGDRAEKRRIQPLHHINWRMEELVATEQTGTRLRGQHCQITARAHQEVQPAHWQVRIGILMAHRATFLAYYSLSRPPA